MFPCVVIVCANCQWGEQVLVTGEMVRREGCFIVQRCEECAGQGRHQQWCFRSHVAKKNG
jgi:hypothetical protein